jgi:hypothetical protein
MSSGGVLMDGTGDIALTSSQWQSTVDIVRSRLKATLHGWQLYPIGADLEALRGQAIQQEVQAQIQQRVTAALTYQFLPSGSFQVKTRAAGESIRIYVYLNNTIAATVTVTNSGTGLVVQTN